MQRGRNVNKEIGKERNDCSSYSNERSGGSTRNKPSNINSLCLTKKPTLSRNDFLQCHNKLDPYLLPSKQLVILNKQIKVDFYKDDFDGEVLHVRKNKKRKDEKGVNKFSNKWNDNNVLKGVIVTKNE